MYKESAVASMWGIETGPTEFDPNSSSLWSWWNEFMENFILNKEKTLKSEIPFLPISTLIPILIQS